MPIMQPPTGPIEISDPNNVPETFVSGPFNVMNAGGMVHITFTTARPNPNDVFKGSTTPQFQGTVVCRLLMPMEMAQHLTRTLADTVIKASQQTRATSEPVTKPTDKSDNWPDRLSRSLNYRSDQGPG
jgi:hypothetical protein